MILNNFAKKNLLNTVFLLLWKYLFFLHLSSLSLHIEVLLNVLMPGNVDKEKSQSLEKWWWWRWWQSWIRGDFQGINVSPSPTKMIQEQSNKNNVYSPQMPRFPLMYLTYLVDVHSFENTNHTNLQLQKRY